MLIFSLAAAVLASAPAAPPPLTAQMTFTSAAPRPGPAGKVEVLASPQGAVFQVRLDDLPPGPHGFHVHTSGSCDDTANAAGEPIAAGAAGPHWDPEATQAHQGPHGQGHLADLPRIEADSGGRAAVSVVAPRITEIQALKGRALVVHVGADTYSDTPEALGGGGRRLACGVLR
ncbi:superoxide dismutase family protein [Phenylobacterium sp. LjRoot164]|uniref:superoxide dismutase family protein n=1 Tax=unclassified Phenylobacterium TaxID=2640670 RepID=UPI003ECDD50D